MKRIKAKELIEKLENEEDGKHRIVKFTASWCGPCKSLSKELKESDIENEYRYSEFYEVDIDDKDNKKLCKLFGVDGVPATFMVQNGELVHSWEGFQEGMIEEMRRVLDGLCPECGSAVEYDDIEDPKQLLREIRRQSATGLTFDVLEMFYGDEIGEVTAEFACEVELTGAYMGDEGLNILLRVIRERWDEELNEKAHEILEDRIHDELLDILPMLEQVEYTPHIWIVGNGDIVA